MPKNIKSSAGAAVLTAPAPAPTPTPKVTAAPPAPKPNLIASNPVRQDQTKPAEPAPGRLPAIEEQDITLKFVAPSAHDVKVAGNFNGWHPDAAPLKNNGSGEWTTHLKLRSGQYEYRFVVDGRWVEDPKAPQRGANPYGGFNSILTVPQATRTTTL